MADVGGKCYTPDILDLLPVREYKCPNGCPGKVYKSRSVYNMHLHKVHHQPMKLNTYFTAFHCPIEGCLYHCEQENAKSFRQLQSLRAHYQRFHMLQKFKCTKCNEEFFLEKQLLAHRCPIIVYKCVKCDMTKRCTASDKSFLTALHGGDLKKNVQTYVCKNCDTRFLRRSIRIIKQIRLKFARNKSAGNDHSGSKGHTKVKSTDREMFNRCDKCKKRFLHKHFCRQYVCFICPHVFYGKSAFNLHLNRHYYRDPLIDNDQVFLEEMEQLLKKIEYNEVKDSALIEELIKLLPLFLTASE